MNDYWFKRRRYGLGWVPASREGWWVIIGFIAVVFAAAGTMMLVSPGGDPWAVVAYLAVVTAAALGLVWVATKKGPSAKWRWGKKPDDDPDLDY